MRIDVADLKTAYANTPMNRGQRIDWLLTRRDELIMDNNEAFQEFQFISDEMCKLLGARLCLLATREELTGTDPQ